MYVNNIKKRETLNQLIKISIKNKYKKDIIYNNFDWKFYTLYYTDLNHIKNEFIAWEHYITHGKKENRIINNKYTNQIDNRQTLALIFICHNIESLNMVSKYLKIENCFIIIVGNQINFDDENDIFLNEKIIIAKNYQFNIENEYKLLTFTAWYLIVKNNLFINYTHLCILEYDAYFKNDYVFDNLKMLIQKYDIITFNAGNFHFHTDIKIDVINQFLKLKNIDVNYYNNSNLFWFFSTNHCIKRDIISEFVDWYYPHCHYIRSNHHEKYSYYHERLFSVYILDKKYNIFLFKNSLIHDELRSHNNYNPNYNPNTFT